MAINQTHELCLVVVCVAVMSAFISCVLDVCAVGTGVAFGGG